MIRPFAIALLVAGFAGPARAEPIRPADSFHLQGSDIFLALLQHQGLKPVAEVADSELKSTVIVIYGQLPLEIGNRIELAKLARRCLHQGGAVLLATNRKADLTPYFPDGSGPIGIDGRIVLDPGEGAHFSQFADLPFVRFGNAAKIADADLGAASLLHRVVTNRPSFIALPARDEHFTVYGSFFGRAEAVGGGEPGPLIAVAARSVGQAVVIADSGMLSNQFLAATTADPSGPLDNFEFAIHLSCYLARGPNRSVRRTHCIYWDAGIQRTAASGISLAPEVPEIRPSWEMIQRSIAENADRKLEELQKQDFPNRNLLNAMPFETIMQRLGVFAAIAAAIWLLRLVRAGRNEREIPLQNPVILLPSSTAAALLDSHNLWSAAREKLRRQFADWQVPEQQHPPLVAVEGSWFYRNRMEKSVRTLWAVAFGPQPVRVSKLRWAELDREIAGIDAALRAGQLRFPAAEPTS